MAASTETIPGPGFGAFLQWMYADDAIEVPWYLTQYMAGRVEIRAEIKALIEATSAPKTADELLVVYEDQEALLIKNLRTMKARQEEEEGKTDEIRTLAEEMLETYAGKENQLLKSLRGFVASKSAEEMLENYAGKENQLLESLRRLKSEQDTISEIKSLAEETKVQKSAGEILAIYAGKEDELLKSFRKLKAGQVQKAETIAEIKIRTV